MTVAARGKVPHPFLYACFGMCLGPPPSPPPKTPAPGLPAKKPPESKGPIENWREIPLVTQYDLLKQLGKGGFSEIWLAEHRTSHELVAIKVVQLVDAELEPDEVTTLLSEAKYLRTLDCPYLLQCRDAVHTGQHLVLVLEYLSGGELLEQIHKVKKYTEAEASKLFAQVVSAVSYMHNLNLLHRDIKPENIMFERPVEVCQAEGRPFRVKLIDLGMAAQYDENKPIIGTVGTPGFVAPELWNDKPHTYACDIYSLGVVLFVMLTGRKPHSGADIRMMTYCNKSIHDAPGLKDERFLALSSTARSLLLSMLADDPADRPTAAAVLRHPFITAVDSNAEAQREVGDVVRRRMMELAQLRRVHGLRYALHVQQRQNRDRLAALEQLDKQRLRRMNSAAAPRLNLPLPSATLEPPSAMSIPESHLDAAMTSNNDSNITIDAASSTAQTPVAVGASSAAAPAAAAAAAAAPSFARCSLGASYNEAPLAMVMSGHLLGDAIFPVPDHRASPPYKSRPPALDLPSLQRSSASLPPASPSLLLMKSPFAAVSVTPKPPNPLAQNPITASSVSATATAAAANTADGADETSALLLANNAADADAQGRPTSNRGPDASPEPAAGDTAAADGNADAPHPPAWTQHGVHSSLSDVLVVAADHVDPHLAAGHPPGLSHPPQPADPKPRSHNGYQNYYQPQGQAGGAKMAATLPGSAFARTSLGSAAPEPKPALARRSQPVPRTGANFTGAAAGATAGAAGGGGVRVPPFDPMALLNALPHMQRCSTMPGSGLDGEVELAGISPVATARMVEDLLLPKAMSVNPYDLELLAHQHTLEQVLGGAGLIQLEQQQHRQ